MIASSPVNVLLGDEAEAQDGMVQGPREVFLLGWCGDGVGREDYSRGFRIVCFLSKATAWGTVTAETPHESIADKVCARCNPRSGAASPMLGSLPLFSW